MTWAETVELNESATHVARRLRRAALAPVWVACIAAGIDLATLPVAFWFAEFGVSPADGFGPLGAGFRGLSAAAIIVALLAATRAYEPPALRRPIRSLVHALAAILPLASLAALGAPAASVPLLLAWLAAASCVLLATRLAGAGAIGWAIDAGLTERRAVLAGGGENAARLIRGLAARPGNDIRVVGIFDDRDEARSPPQVLGVPKIGDYDDLVRFIRAAEVDMVIVTLPLEAEARINWLLAQLKVLPVAVRLSAFSQDFAFRDRTGDGLIAAIGRSFAPERRLAKRSFDVVVAALALLALSPVMLLAALAVRLDSPGPVLFRQARHGFNDRAIQVLKFRSMYSEAADPAARQVVTRGDPRVTRVGRILRKTSIDELPQLFNVLRGELSLVGPRPHAVEALSSAQEKFSQMVEGYSARHRLPPGITGWAQIHGWRGEIDDADKLRARFEHDLWYIENWSIWLDLAILLRTPLSLLDTRSAY